VVVDFVSMAVELLLLESTEAVSMSLVLVAMLGSAWRVGEKARQMGWIELVVVSLVSRWLLVGMAVRW